ncbi:hypothetical protein BO70DRAFT_380236 [Aspergillus heteromorphus CBS 117.55]|uniref:Telomeric single stranded DNA binding POT1/Cdc13 domain-containing protein n=1 Tax=Aspergillus heteromorphus CBS 117.55 TaxID=1448321 RepID=A0A317W3E0_9EURO|nr:uncharacterized protein BO70DRAFT_380236 [Aspergillus heteromorphus CBS 117.55]PWY79638.1 hypothetical protein BO70DRAFT_380236 [Aspergillus heteromorphus CBS 117.55]
MDIHEKQPPASEPLRSTPVPIAQLSPTLENLSESSIHAVVTLLWPYSSSTRSISLLVAEPDFRLRRTNGQVKVVFHGHVAQEVAKSQIGIGDSVYLRLAGARFLDHDAENQTPGRFVAWDVHFDNNVLLEVWRSSQHLSTVSIDRSSSPSPATDDAIKTPSTPTANGRANLDELHANSNSHAWQSPAFVDRSRKSLGHITRTVYEPLEEEDGFVPGKGRKRPRFSMPGTQWRVIDEPASPGDNDIPGDWTAMFDDDAWYKSESGGEDDVEEARESPQPSESRDTVTIPEKLPDGVQANDVTAESVPVAIEPNAENQVDEPKSDAQFLLPELSQRTEPLSRFRHNVPNFAGHLPIDTPRLRPIPSPGLPIPSPLVSTSNSPHGYFGSISATVQGSSARPTTFLSQEVMSIEKEAVSHAPSDEHITISSAPDPAPHIPAAGSGHDTVQPASVFESIATETKYAEAVGMTEHIGILSPTPVVQTAASDVTEHMEVEQEPEDIALQEGEISEAEYDKEELDAREARDDFGERRIPNERQNDNGSGASLYASRETYLDSEDYDSESVDQSSVIEDRSGDMVEDYEDIAEEDTEQPAVETRESIEISSESEAQSPVRTHDDVKRGYGYYAEEDEDMEDEDEVSDGEESLGSEESESIYDDDYRYGERVESEYASEDDAPYPPPQPIIRNTEPEIIVLDSDSDEEPAPTAQAPSITQQEQVAAFSRRPESYASSSDVASDYGSSGSSDDEDEEDEEGGAEYADQRVERDFSNSDAEDWSDQDDQEAQEREAKPVDLDSVDGRPFKSEQEDVVQSEDEEAHKLVDGERSVDEIDSVNRPGHGPGSDEHMQAEQPDDKNAGYDQLKAEEISDESVHGELAEDEQPGDERVKVEHLEAGAMDDDHLENNEVYPFADTNRKIFGTVPDRRHGIDVDQHPGFQADFEELRPAEVTTHPSGHEEDENIAQSIHFAQQPDIDTEHLLHLAEPPIDPVLFNTGSFPTEAPTSISQQHGAEPSQSHIQDDQMSDSQYIDPSLSLDGVSQSMPIFGGVASKLPVYPQDQLFTPDPSQAAGTDNQIPQIPPEVEAPPTPKPTQESSIIQLKAETSSTVEVVPDTSTTTDTGRVLDSKPKGQIPSIEREERYEGSGDEELVLPIHSEDEILLVGEKRARLLDMNRNYPGLRSEYSYFAPLATLIDHYNALTDTISVVAEIRPPVRAPSGKKDYILTFGVTDPSLAGTILYTQIFRPYKSALPSLEEGDAILLRNFQVKSFNHSMTLASVDTSAWAVFSATKTAAQVDGPPVEYGAEEQTYATDMRQWYQEDGMAMVADYQLQASIEQESREATPYSSAGFSDSGSVISTAGEGRPDSSLSNRGSRRRKSHRRITIHELRDGRRYAEVGSPSSKDSIHELRDGTVYANF